MKLPAATLKWNLHLQWEYQFCSVAFALYGPSMLVVKVLGPTMPAGEAVIH